MDKFEQLKKEYDLLQKSSADFFDPANPNEFEFYIELAMLRIWSSNGRYSEDYARAIQAISGKPRTPAQITQAMLDSIEPAEISKIPSFFARMVAADFEAGSRRAKNFVGDLKSLLAGAAFINGDFTIEESNMLSAELKKLMTYAISQGVKVDYATGRIREKVTPLKEDSYVSPDVQARVSAELMFDVLDRDFLRPSNGGRKSGSGSNGPGGSGGNKTGGGSTGHGSDVNDGRVPIGSIFSAGGTNGGSSGGTGGSNGIGGSGGNGTVGGNGPAFAGDGAVDAAAVSFSQQTPAEIKEDPRTMEELMAELDSLVGLTGIKEDIRSLMNFITITKLREERGLSVPTISYHLVFTGNPGTGKTTVARLVAGLYHRIGILPKGQLVEADRSRLVAGYTGQTAIKTMEVISQAMGGVLFIDEAYALVNDDQDSFGKECIETILKAMEDHRDELVVIVAGYTELMHKFVESNPGFRSRFSKFFEFPDYTGEELLEILRTFCRKNGYHMTEEAEAYLLLQFNDMYEHRDSHFGNGRTARNVFEKAIHQQANRLAGLVDGIETPDGDSKPAHEEADGAASEKANASGEANEPSEANAEGVTDTDDTGDSDGSAAANAEADGSTAAETDASSNTASADTKADHVTDDQLQ